MWSEEIISRFKQGVRCEFQQGANADFMEERGSILFKAMV